jgi:predicted RND superfamily exporter protein
MPMFARLADWIVRNRWPLLVVLAVATVASFLIAQRLKFDFTIEALFYGEQEERQFSEHFNETFAHEDNLVVVMLEATGDDDVLAAPAIEWQTRMTELLARVPHAERVVSLATLRVPRQRFYGGSSTMMVPVVRQDREIDEKENRLVRAKVADTPIIDGMLISADRQCAAVVVYLRGEVNDVSDVNVVMKGIQNTLEDEPAPSGYQSHLTGLPFIRLDISQRLATDQRTIMPICAGLFLTILVWMYRSWSGLMIPMVSIGAAVLWTLATMVLLDEPLNIVTNVLPVLLMTVGVSNCVHVVSYFSEQSLLTPGDRLGTARRTLTHMGSACLLTCVTTAVGFLSLLVADARVLSGFGWQAAMGMAYIYIATLLAAGTLMPIMKAPDFVRTKSGTSDENADREDSLLARIAVSMGDFSARRPYAALSGAVWVIVGALFLGSFVTIDSKLMETYVSSMRLVEDKLGGFMPLEISLTTKDPAAFQNAETFFRVANASSYLRSLPDVSLVRSYVDLYRQIDRKLPGRTRLQDDEPNEELAEDAETRARLADAHRRLADPAIADDTPYLQYLSDDGTHARISVHVRDSGIRHLRPVYEEIESRLNEILPPGTGIDVRLTGDAYYSGLALRHLISELFYSLIAAAAVIFVVIAVLFRSVRMAVASILPNVTPLVVTLGYMGLHAAMGHPSYVLNTGNVIVFAISLGIAVDDSIHFLARFRDELDAGGHIDDIIHRTCLGTGRAIVMTSLLIVAGLSVVHMSQFTPTRLFAELTTVTMLAALLGDLVLLPACLKIIWQWRASAEVETPVLKIVRHEQHQIGAAS